MWHAPPGRAAGTPGGDTCWRSARSREVPKLDVEDGWQRTPAVPLPSMPLCWQEDRVSDLSGSSGEMLAAYDASPRAEGSAPHLACSGASGGTPGVDAPGEAAAAELEPPEERFAFALSDGRVGVLAVRGHKARPGSILRPTDHRRE